MTNHSEFPKMRERGRSSPTRNWHDKKLSSSGGHMGSTLLIVVVIVVVVAVWLWKRGKPPTP
ncbi:MAG TPA: hypothetical protein VIM36_15360 [Gemmatimonadaceae bacterium]